MADSSEVIATFEKNSRERVQISLDNFKGKDIVNIRVYYRNEAEQWAPGKQGIALSVEKFEALMTGLGRVAEKLKAKKAST